MRIVCESCSASHEIDPPAWVLSSGRAFRFRCSHCGHSQAASQPEPPKSPEPPTRPSESSLFLRQEGQIYLIKDWATLIRWIHEGRVEPTDQLSEGGVEWRSVQDNGELKKLFPELVPHVPPVQDGFRAPDPDADNLAWRDDDTAGIPTGLPPLPINELNVRIAPPQLLQTPVSPPEREIVPRDPERAPIRTRSRDIAPAMRGIDRPDETTSIEILANQVPTPAQDSAIAAAPTVTPSEIPTTPSESTEESVERDANVPASAIASEPTATPVASRSGEPRPSDLPTVEPLPARGTQPPVDAPESDPFGFSAPTDAHDEAPTPAGDDLLASFGDFDVSEEGQGQAVNWPLVAFGVAAFVTLVAVILILVWWASVANPGRDRVEEAVAPGTPLADVAAPPVPAPVEPAPEPAPPEPTEDAVAMEGEPEVEEVPAPSPAPDPAPASPRPAPRPSPPLPDVNVSALLRQGWDNVDKDPPRAERAFREVLARNPDDKEASYGLGYAMLQQKKEADAAEFLCAARGSKDVEIARDVSGLIARYKVVCP